MLRFLHAFLRCSMVALLGLPGLGHAYSACVRTGQELADALGQATATTDATITIKVHEGTYPATPGLSYYLNLTHSNQTVTLSGGWTGDSCDTHRLGVDRTVLNGSSNSAALQLNAGFGTSGNTINATDLTLRNDEGIQNNAIGACLHVLLTTGAVARVHRLRLEGCVGAKAAVLDNGGADLTFANSVVVGGFNADAPVHSTSSNAVTHLSNLTITGNTATSTSEQASGLWVKSTVGSQVTIDNSVVWGGIAPDGIPDIATDGTGIELTRAHYETRTYINGAVTDNMPSHGDPELAGPGNPRPRNDSVLIDSGVALTVGGTHDVDGAQRTQGAAVDVGAYETDPDRLFADGLDH